MWKRRHVSTLFSGTPKNKCRNLADECWHRMSAATKKPSNNIGKWRAQTRSPQLLLYRFISTVTKALSSTMLATYAHYSHQNGLATQTGRHITSAATHVVPPIIATHPKYAGVPGPR
mmetsp:Transcript_7076/g.13146  ORF Transcript_7076/g.13146 Transcript_7076/m.13146 type:complete len:117 (-) Transcript_7076:399-749(-)